MVQNQFDQFRPTHFQPPQIFIALLANRTTENVEKIAEKH
jgi:hypothetical protein